MTVSMLDNVGHSHTLPDIYTLANIEYIEYPN